MYGSGGGGGARKLTLAPVVSPVPPGEGWYGAVDGRVGDSSLLGSGGDNAVAFKEGLECHGSGEDESGTYLDGAEGRGEMCHNVEFGPEDVLYGEKLTIVDGF